MLGWLLTHYEGGICMWTRIKRRATVSLSVPACLFQGCLPLRHLPHFLWSHGLELRLVLTVPRSSDGFSTHRSKNTESTCDEQQQVRWSSSTALSLTTAFFDGAAALSFNRIDFGIRAQTWPHILSSSDGCRNKAGSVPLFLLHRPELRGWIGWESLFTITPVMCDACLAYRGSREGWVSPNTWHNNLVSNQFFSRYPNVKVLYEWFFWRASISHKHSFLNHRVTAKFNIAALVN